MHRSDIGEDMVQPPPVYTIGYGSRTTDDLVHVLKAHGIEYLIDVRSAPYSRFKPEFSKGELESRLHRHGICYIYLGDKLGGRPDDRDCYIDDRVVYARVKKKPFYRAGIARIRDAYLKGLRIVLMCSEGRPEECHRSKLIGESLTELGIPVAHIDENDAPCAQSDVMYDLTDGQLSLFGEHDFTSRKHYPTDAGRQEDDET